MKILKNKKGMALENAILFMLIIFTFCALLTSLTLYGHYQTKLEKVMMTNRVELDQIGEDYLDSLKNGTKISTDNENYEINTGNNTLTVKNKNDKIILYVQASIDNGNITVEKWCYGELQD